MTIVVMMAAKNTNPPNTPRAMIPPTKKIDYLLCVFAKNNFTRRVCLPKLSCCCLVSLLFWTDMGSSAPWPGLACTAASGISLLISGNSRSTKLSISLGFDGDGGRPAEPEVGNLVKGGTSDTFSEMSKRCSVMAAHSRNMYSP